MFKTDGNEKTNTCAGAGTADAVLSNEADTPGFLNATYQQFELGDNLQWGFVLDSALNYAGKKSPYHHIILNPS